MSFQATGQARFTKQMIVELVHEINHAKNIHLCVCVTKKVTDNREKEGKYLHITFQMINSFHNKLA